MCGIVGYIGKADATSVLINGLRRLEYRGYDSAGLAVMDDGCIAVAKSRGKASSLSERARTDWPADRFERATTGIAHTRWAAHGPPTEANAHPHLDRSGGIALVHNGIIENYRALRARLESKGHAFLSETDTEVLAHLIGDCDKVDIRDLHNVPVTREIAELGLDAAAAEKGGFDHFMLKEIHSPPPSPLPWSCNSSPTRRPPPRLRDRPAAQPCEDCDGGMTSGDSLTGNREICRLTRIIRLGYPTFVMKILSLLLLSMSVPVLAGTSAKEVVAPAQAPEPCLFTWFAGGSVGYLTELEEPMYNLHLGTDTCWSLGGWKVALFAEIGFAEKDESWSGSRRFTNGSIIPDAIIEPEMPDVDSGSLDDLAGLLDDISDNTPYDTSYDFDVMPITLNAKLERPLTNNLSAYFGAGLGVALVDLSVDAGPFDFDDDDWVFTGQVFAGLNYNFNEAFEMYGGARWIYYDDADISGSTLEMDDDFLFELGARFNF